MAAKNQDFVVKNGLQVTSNLVVGDLVNIPYSEQIDGGGVFTTNVGVGTSVVVAGTRLNVADGNIQISTPDYGLVFSDGSIQRTSAENSVPPGGVTNSIQYNSGTNFAGSSSFVFDPSNTRVGIGTSVMSQMLDIYGNIHIGNTATTSGIVFPDGSFQDTAFVYTPSFGPQYTVQLSGAGNSFSGDATNLYWDPIAPGLHLSNVYATGDITANHTIGVGTAIASYTLDIYGNVHIGNTATTSGIVFPDGTFQDTAAFYTPSYGPIGTLQFAGSANTFSGDGSSLYWDSNSQVLHAGNVYVDDDITVAGNFTVSGITTFTNVAISSDLIVNSVTSNTFVQAAWLVQSDTFIANVNVGIGTATMSYPLDIYGNIHIGNTATTSGIVFPDGTFQTTAVTPTPSFGPQYTLQFAGTANAFSGDGDKLYWDAGSSELVSSNIQATGTIGIGTTVASHPLDLYGNLHIGDTATNSGIIFPDGTFQTTSAANTPSFGPQYTLQFAGTGNTFSGDGSNLYWYDQDQSLVSTNATVTGTLNTALLQADAITGNGSGSFGGNLLVSGSIGVGTSSLLGVGNALAVFDSADVFGNVCISNTTTGGSGIFFPDGTFQSTASYAAALVAGGNKSVQFNDGGTFGGTSTFVYDKLTDSVGIGTNIATNTLTAYGSSPALFNTTSGSDQQIIVGNTSTDGAVLAFNSGATTAYGYLKYRGASLTNVAFTKTGTGIGGITVPINTLDIGGGAAIGFAYAGVQYAPGNGLIVQGRVGLGTYSPGTSLDINGWASIRQSMSVVGTAWAANIIGNTSVTTGILNATSQAVVADMISNTNITAATLVISGQAVASSLNSNTTIQSASGAIVDYLISNNNVYGATLQSTGQASVGSLASNTNVVATNLQSTGQASVASLVSNADTTTATLNSTGAAQAESFVSNTTVQVIGGMTAESITSNTNVVATNLQSTGQASVASLVSNTNITTATLNSTGAAQVSSLISNTTIQGIGTATLNAVISNNNVYGATLQSGGQATVASLVSNADTTTATLNSTGAAQAASFTSNTTIQVIGAATVNSLISNTNVFGATLQSSGQARLASLVVNANTTTSTLNSTGAARVASLISNTSTTTATLNSTGAAQAASFTSNTTIQVIGTATVNSLVSNNNVYGATLNIGGQARVASLISNADTTTATLNSTGAAQAASFTSNTTIQVIGTATVNALVSNNNVYGATLQSGGQALVDSLVSNGAISGASLSVGGAVVAQSLTSNTTIQAATDLLADSITSNTNVVATNLQSTGPASVASLISNASTTTATLNSTGAAQAASFTSNTTIQVIGTATVNALVSNNNVFGTSINSNGLVQASVLSSNAAARIGGTLTANAIASNTNVVATNLQSTGQASVASLVSNTNITTATLNSTGAAVVSNLTSNAHVKTGTLNATSSIVGAAINSNGAIQAAGTATVAALVSNTDVKTGTLNATSSIVGAAINSNTTIQAAGTATVNRLVSNAGIYSANINIAGLAYVNDLISNTNITANTLNSKGLTQTANMVSNGYTTTATLNATGAAQVNDLTVNTVIRTSTITSTGEAIFASINSNGTIQSAGTTTVNALISNTNVFGATLQSSGQALVGSLTSNTTIQSNGAAVFNTFTANTRSYITSGGFAVTGDSLVTGNLTVTGNLAFGGNAFTINTQSLTIVDPIIELGIGTGGTALTIDDGLDRGEYFDYFKNPAYNGETAGFNHAFLGMQSSSGRLLYITNVAPGTLNVGDTPSSLPGTRLGSVLFGNIHLGNGIASTDTATGGVVTIGGIGVGGNINVGGQRSNFSGNVNIGGSNAATSATTGALTVAGGVGVLGSMFVGGNLRANNGAQFSFVTTSNAITTASLFSNGIIQTAGTVTAALVNSNGTVVGANVYSNGFVQAAGTVTAALVNSNGTVVGANVYSNGFVQAAGTITAALVNSNGTVVGANVYSNGFVQAAGTATVNASYSNTFVQAAGNGLFASISSNTWGYFGQNVTINSTNASTDTSTGALELAGGAGIGGNINVGGTRSLFTNRVGIGTTTALGVGNVLSVYGSSEIYGNLVIDNTAAGGSGIYFPDGTFQQTASSIGGIDKSVQFNDGGVFGGNNVFIYDDINNRLGIGTANLTNSLMVYSATPALFNTTNGADQQIMVGNTATDGATMGFNNGATTAYGYLKYTGAAINMITFNKTGVGIAGITIPRNPLEVGGTAIIGASWSGNPAFISPPANGMAVQGSVGVGTFTPLSTLDVRGVGSFTTAMSVGGQARVASLISNANTTTATLNSTGAAQAASFISNTTIQSIGTATVNALVSNNNIYGATLNTGGLAQLTNVISNGYVTTATLNSTGAAQVSSLISNTNTTTATLNSTGAAQVSSLISNTTIQSIGTATVNALVSNNNIYGATLNTGGLLQANDLISNTNTTTATLNSEGLALVNALISNTNTTTATLNSTGAAQASSFTSNTTIQVIGTATVNALVSNNNIYGATLQSGGQATVASLVSNTTISGASISLTGAAVVSSLTSNTTVQAASAVLANSITSNTSVQAAGQVLANALVSNVYGLFGQNVTVNSANASSTSGTGALVVSGGVGIGGRLNVAGAAYFASTLNSGGTAVVNALTSNGAISGTTGAFSGAITLTGAAPQINLNNATSNWIAWNTAGVAAPTFTTRSAGTKLVLYPNIGATNADFALGIEGSTLWQSVNATSSQFKWYGGVTQAMLLSGAGALTTTSTATSTAFIPSGASVPTDGMYLPSANTLGFATASTLRVTITSAGAVGIATSSPGAPLGVYANNSTAGATPSHVQYINAGSQTVSSWNFGGTVKATHRVDNGGNTVFNSAANGFYFNNESIGGGTLGTANFYTTGAQPFMTASANIAVFPSVVTTTNGSIADTYDGLRLVNPGGASNVAISSSITGAIKIKLPTSTFGSTTMMQMTVKIYEYAGSSAGTSRTINLGGYNYNDAAYNWYNIYATQITMGGGDINVRFGNDGTSQCIWIGDTTTTWAYPQILVTDFQGGHGNYTTARWGQGWNVSVEAAYDTVTQGPIVCAKNLTTTGGWTVTGTMAATGAVTAAAFIPNGASIPTNGVFLPAADTVGFSTAGVEEMRIAPDGNVGINTTTTTNAKVSIVGGTGGSAGELYMNAGTNWIRMASSLASGAYNTLVQAGDQALIYSGGTVGTTGALTIAPWNSAACGMRLDNWGNVSIGTASVFYANAARTTLSVNGTTTSLIALGTGGTQRGYLYHTGSAMYLAGSGDMYVGPDSANILYLRTAGADRMRITSTGNVAIGTPGAVTPAGLSVISNINNAAFPLKTLDASTVTIRNDSVAGLNINASLNFNVATIGASVIAGYYAAFNASNDIGTGLQFGTQANAAGGTVERMRIDQFGNVCIGTTSVPYSSPGRTVLAMNGTAASLFAMQANSSNSCYLYATGSSNQLVAQTGDLQLYAITANPITFYTNSAERVRIDSAGNVGIATTTIQTGYNFQVQGNAAFTNRVGIGTSAIAGISNALVVYGSAMVYGNIDLANPAGGTSGIYFNDGTYQTTAASGNSSYSNINAAGYLSGSVVIGNLTISNTTASSSTTTGALLMGGGAGIQGNVYVGGNVVAASPGSTVTQFWASANDTAAQPGYAWVGATAKGMFNAGTNILGFSTAGTERMRIDASGNVGINTTSVSAGYKLQVNGGFAAITKSFVIKHPTKPGMLLRHGSLEGPENAVYVRGRLTGSGPISLPDYWRDLVDESTITATVTPIGGGQQLAIGHVSAGEVRVIDTRNPGGQIDCYYLVMAERRDVPRLIVEE